MLQRKSYRRKSNQRKSNQRKSYKKNGKRSSRKLQKVRGKSMRHKRRTTMRGGLDDELKNTYINYLSKPNKESFELLQHVQLAQEDLMDLFKIAQSYIKTPTVPLQIDDKVDVKIVKNIIAFSKPPEDENDEYIYIPQLQIGTTYKATVTNVEHRDENIKNYNTSIQLKFDDFPDLPVVDTNFLFLPYDKDDKEVNMVEITKVQE
jgi:hypothetical protein